jgi:hypothetical protein
MDRRMPPNYRPSSGGGLTATVHSRLGPRWWSIVERPKLGMRERFSEILGRVSRVQRQENCSNSIVAPCAVAPDFVPPKKCISGAKTTPKLNRAQIGGRLQVPVALRVTEREHIVIWHVSMVFLENGRSATSFTWQ